MLKCKQSIYIINLSREVVAATLYRESSAALRVGAHSQAGMAVKSLF